ncbi:hypothetical protein C942_03463 [Photobacterium marinum]|uniref:Uncharacterized protein n=1 Tax=Photobacterium marinum TaxID=1056511 RepID=L8J411_9GAMM|nr:hypothetical protein C942_03463 [Photobacterium marinum]
MAWLRQGFICLSRLSTTQLTRQTKPTKTFGRLDVKISIDLDV